MIKLADYDFLGSLYKNTKAYELGETFESIKNQTHQPKNIFLVFDGNVKKNVSDLVENYKKTLPIKIISLKKNVGLGVALKKGLLQCKSDIILRFDTDDINLQKRAELIVRELEKGDFDIVGSNVYEFDQDPKVWVSKKEMPLTHKAISRSLVYRNPINHPSVGFLRKSILKLNGGYRHFPFYEDYDLWIRAFFGGLKFRNINQELVALRITNQRVRRRGLKLVYSELKLLFTFFNFSIFHGFIFLPFCLLRIIFALMPLKIVTILYTKIFRTKL